MVVAENVIGGFTLIVSTIIGKPLPLLLPSTTPSAFTNTLTSQTLIAYLTAFFPRIG